MSLEVCNIVKKTPSGITALNIQNALNEMKTPKFVFKIGNPPREGGTYRNEKAYLDLKDTISFIRNVRIINQENPTEIHKAYKGGFDKNYNTVVSRVFKAERIIDKKAVVLTIDISEGEQSLVANKNGEKVPGIVKPKRGGRAIDKVSIYLTKEEILYAVDLLDKEIIAWRTAINIDNLYHPEKYRRDFSQNAMS